MKDIDSPDRIDCLQNRIKKKRGLCRLYKEFYSRYAECIARSSTDGLDLEIGSGAGFIKEILPGTIATDILHYRTIDLVVDAMQMPFVSNSLRSVFLLNTLHHIPNVDFFFRELERCLFPGGRVLVIDQFPGFFSDFLYKYLHHEPYDKKAVAWSFHSSGPLSGANGALAWIVFYRDVEKFHQLYPQLEIVSRRPHTPFRYWLTGGLKWWTLLPGFTFAFWTIIDKWLAFHFPSMCSFVEIEIEKKAFG